LFRLFAWTLLPAKAKRFAHWYISFTFLLTHLHIVLCSSPLTTTTDHSRTLLTIFFEIFTCDQSSNSHSILEMGAGASAGEGFEGNTENASKVVEGTANQVSKQ
jgi:hypothetical protein